MHDMRYPIIYTGRAFREGRAASILGQVLKKDQCKTDGKFSM